MTSTIRKLVRSPLFITGMILLLPALIFAAAAQWIAPHDPHLQTLGMRLTPPAWQAGGSMEHLFGTDALGRDLFSRIIYGARVSLLIGLTVVVISGVIGTLLGVLAGYFGGWADRIITAYTNLLLSIPYLVLVIVVATILGSSLTNVILLFGFTSSPVFVRVTRGEVLRLRKLSYVEAAVGLGAGPGRIIPRHILPNIVGPLATLATFEMSAMIFYESGLGFLGLSVPPDVPSWGNMLALGRRFLTIYPWMAIYPGLAIALTTLGINLLGDWLRDTIDPRAKER